METRTVIVLAYFIICINIFCITSKQSSLTITRRLLYPRPRVDPFSILFAVTLVHRLVENAMKNKHPTATRDPNQYDLPLLLCQDQGFSKRAFVLHQALKELPNKAESSQGFGRRKFRSYTHTVMKVTTFFVRPVDASYGCSSVQQQLLSQVGLGTQCFLEEHLLVTFLFVKNVEVKMVRYNQGKSFVELVFFYFIQI